MPTLRKELAEILQKYGENPATATWDCHGTWVIYHKSLERIAAKASIKFPPEETRVLEANGANGCAALMVVGQMGDHTEWATGEASPSNNKNSFAYAMAEKRGKDRVILKLVGLSGEIYSEEEADDFKPREPVSPRDFAGTAPPEEGEKFELYDQYGNVENIFHDANAFITSLSTLVKDHAHWWPNNRDTVTYIGKNAGDNLDLKKHSRLLWKLGEGAVKNVGG
jgi:hypothetical protein